MKYLVTLQIPVQKRHKDHAYHTPNTTVSSDSRTEELIYASLLRTPYNKTSYADSDLNSKQETSQ